ncbi:MAG: Hsp20/alpha crystallin family protein [Acidobacteriota bacterium]
MARHLIQTPSPDISEQVREQLRRLLMHFDDLRLIAPPPGAWLPSIDLCEMTDSIVIRVELPGVAQGDLRLTILDNIIKIEGRKKRRSRDTSDVEKPLRYVCLERAYGRFERTILLQWPVEVERVSARLIDGVLEVRLPKTQSAGREVPIPIST